MLRFGDLVCFSFKKKKKQQQPKAAKHSPNDPEEPRQAAVPGEQFLGHGAWQLAPKKPAIASFPQCPLRIWLWFFSEGPIFFPPLLQEKCSDPA